MQLVLLSIVHEGNSQKGILFQGQVVKYLNDESYLYDYTDTKVDSREKAGAFLLHVGRSKESLIVISERKNSRRDSWK